MNQYLKNYKINLYRHLLKKLDLSLTPMHFSFFHS
ncbi:hypothetical protein [Acinetobacter nosocomialis]|nr:hypothetical protein [Acinetobacter nosocomialis]MBR7740537.1 hypothetical protein [Acinetobacter nosocomialis]MBR7749849.1 hypothetical protein [Acinetobacter nosocomialis]